MFDDNNIFLLDRDEAVAKLEQKKINIENILNSNVSMTGNINKN